MNRFPWLISALLVTFAFTVEAQSPVRIMPVDPAQQSVLRGRMQAAQKELIARLRANSETLVQSPPSFTCERSITKKSSDLTIDLEIPRQNQRVDWDRYKPDGGDPELIEGNQLEPSVDLGASLQAIFTPDAEFRLLARTTLPAELNQAAPASGSSGFMPSRRLGMQGSIFIVGRSDSSANYAKVYADSNTGAVYRIIIHSLETPPELTGRHCWAERN